MGTKKSGGQPGNNNATKGRPWLAAINRALAKRNRCDQKEALDDLAEKLLKNCEEGEISALKELGDRLEGKPAQTILGDSDSPLVVNLVKFRDD